MDDLISFLGSREAILVYIIAFVVSLGYIVFYFIKKKKQDYIKRQNTMELKMLTEENELLEKKNILPEVRVTNTLEKEAELIEKNSLERSVEMLMTPNMEGSEKVDQKEKIEEVLVIQNEIMEEEQKKVVESVPIIENKASSVVVEKEEIAKDDSSHSIVYVNREPLQEEARQQLEEVVKDLEEEKVENIELTEFERLQEDTAIISLDELMQKAGEMYEKNEQVQYQDEGNEPISLADLEKRKEEVMAVQNGIDEKKELEKASIDDFYQVETLSVNELKPISNEPKFKSSPVISPVYGIEKEESKTTSLELENTANYEKLDEEIRKTNQFLVALKELQKKLD